jgi:DNA polymerase
MKIIALDFETYFDNDYTLKKLTTEAYIRDDRFAAHGAAIYDGKTAQWLLPRQLKELCEVLKNDFQDHGHKIALLAHHAHFDGLILSHHFDFCPDIWLDTLSMARVVFDSGVRNGLDDLSSRLGLAPKSVPYELFKSKHWHELDAGVQNMVASGCMHDCELTWHAFHAMMRGGTQAVPYAFPASELPVVSATVKMFTEPMLVGDQTLLSAAWMEELRLKKAVLDEFGLLEDDMRQDDKFAGLLRSHGEEPETKTTAKGNVKYAFAKSDWYMQRLLEHDDERLAAAAEMKLKTHSSIYQTRAERFLDIAKRGSLPIYLAYGAAHTRRWGGGDKQNAQNLPRSDPYKPQKGALRRAIKAP